MRLSLCNGKLKLRLNIFSPQTQTFSFNPQCDWTIVCMIYYVSIISVCLAPCSSSDAIICDWPWIRRLSPEFRNAFTGMIFNLLHILRKHLSPPLHAASHSSLECPLTASTEQVPLIYYSALRKTLWTPRFLCYVNGKPSFPSTTFLPNDYNTRRTR